MSKPGELWKILKPAYGFVESGRLWQMTLEPWLLNTYRFEKILALPQLFVLKSNNRSLQMILAKVVYDFLLAGLPSETSRFYRTKAKRFQVGRFTKGTVLVFSRLHIMQKSNGDIEMSMEEYMGTISKLGISRERSKLQ